MFWKTYLNIPMNSSPDRLFFSKPRGVLWCPSGTRTSYTSANAQNNPTVWDGNPYANFGWQRSIDYALVGCAPVIDQYPLWPASATRWWEYTPAGPRVFSMDIARSNGAGTPALVLARTPHPAQDGIADGMNVVTTDGAGGWQPRAACTQFGGNRPDGCWQYYVNWAYMVMPKNAEVLYTEWNYTYNWPPGGVFASRNGVYSSGYSLSDIGLMRWP
jgi:hypothetical protein